MDEVKEDEVLPDCSDIEISSDDDYSDEEAEEANDRDSNADICIEVSDDDEEVSTFTQAYKEVCVVVVTNTNL